MNPCLKKWIHRAILLVSILLIESYLNLGVYPFTFDYIYEFLVICCAVIIIDKGVINLVKSLYAYAALYCLIGGALMFTILDRHQNFWMPLISLYLFSDLILDMIFQKNHYK